MLLSSLYNPFDSIFESLERQFDPFRQVPILGYKDPRYLTAYPHYAYPGSLTRLLHPQPRLYPLHSALTPALLKIYCNEAENHAQNKQTPKQETIEQKQNKAIHNKQRNQKKKVAQSQDVFQNDKFFEIPFARNKQNEVKQQEIVQNQPQEVPKNQIKRKRSKKNSKNSQIEDLVEKDFLFPGLLELSIEEHKKAKQQKQNQVNKKDISSQKVVKQPQETKIAQEKKQPVENKQTQEKKQAIGEDIFEKDEFFRIPYCQNQAKKESTRRSLIEDLLQEDFLFPNILNRMTHCQQPPKQAKTEPQVENSRKVQVQPKEEAKVESSQKLAPKQENPTYLIINDGYQIPRIIRLSKSTEDDNQQVEKQKKQEKTQQKQPEQQAQQNVLETKTQQPTQNTQKGSKKQDNNKKQQKPQQQRKESQEDLLDSFIDLRQPGNGFISSFRPRIFDFFEEDLFNNFFKFGSSKRQQNQQQTKQQRSRTQSCHDDNLGGVQKQEKPQDGKKVQNKSKNGYQKVSQQDQDILSERHVKKENAEDQDEERKSLLSKVSKDDVLIEDEKNSTE